MISIARRSRSSGLITKLTRFTPKLVIRTSQSSVVDRAIVRTAASTCGVQRNVLLRHDDSATGITTLTMNNPEKCNVLTREMLDNIQTEINTIATDETVRVVIIGATGKAFSSGHDLREVQINTHELFSKCSQVMMSLNRMPQPVIAMVQGVATAAGCQLVASCDLAVASEVATFGVSGINLGLFCSTSAVPLSRNINRKQALQMLLTGKLISSSEALSYGLVNKVVSSSNLHQETVGLAKCISSKSNFAVQLGKQMFYEQLEYTNLDDAYALATERVVYNVQHPDSKTGIDEFISRKQP